MRRKPGALVPLELAICRAALALRRNGVKEFHGYQIAKSVAVDQDTRLLTAYGTLYRALGRLEQMGFMTSQWEDPAIPAHENRPGRRLYTLTALADAAVTTAPSEKAPKRARRRLQPA